MLMLIFCYSSRILNTTVTIADPHLTAFSTKSTGTITGVLSDSILTGSIILTDNFITVINICFTHVSSESISAVTGERVDFILAGSTILTGNSITFINISFTFLISEAICTDTTKGIYTIHTCPIALAWMTKTVTNLCFASFSCII